MELELNRKNVRSQSEILWNFPQRILEALSRKYGLILISGPRKSGKSQAVIELVQKIQGSFKEISIFSDSNHYQNYGLNKKVKIHSTMELNNLGLVRSCDVLIIDCLDLDHCELALQMAEEGRLVIFTVGSWHLEMAIHRFTENVLGVDLVKRRRLSSVFHMGLGLQLLDSTDSSKIGAFECLLTTDSVQNLIRNGEFHLFNSLIGVCAEKTGMRTMNHTLVNLMLRRQIDYRTGFEASANPEELDQMLKKIGI